MKRRTFLEGVGTTLAVSSLSAPAFPQSSAQPRGQLVYAGWGGTWQRNTRKYVFDPFEKETGIKVVDVAGSSLAKLKAMAESGTVEWDIADVIGAWVILGDRERLFDTIDLSAIDTKGYPAGSVYSTAVAVDTYTIGFAYNKHAFEGRKAPQSWSDFWNTKDFPGARALFDDPRNALEFALLADGVPRDRLYPLDVNRAFLKLDELKPHVSFFFKQWEQSGRALADGSVALSVFNMARAYPMMKMGAPIFPVWNGAATGYDYLVIPRGTKNRDNAVKFIAWYANNPEAQASLAREFAQGPVNPKGLEFLSAEEREEMSSAHQSETFVWNWEWWADHLANMEERWNGWKLK